MIPPAGKNDTSGFLDCNFTRQKVGLEIPRTDCEFDDVIIETKSLFLSGIW